MAKKRATKKRTVKPKKTAGKRRAMPKPAAKPRAKKPARAARPASKGRKGQKPKGGKKGKARSRVPLSITSQHVDFLTYKSAQLQKFYGDVLELKTEFRDVDGLAYLMVRTSSSSSLGFMPPHPEMKSDQPPPREPSLYFLVEDVDRTYQYLLGKGVAFVHAPETMPWGHRVITTTDPEGRTVMMASKVAPED